MVPETKVPVEVAGRRLYLRYSMYSLAEAQRAAGFVTFDGLLGELKNLEQATNGKRSVYDVDFDLFGAVLWAGLLEAAEETGERLSRQEVTRSVTLRRFIPLLTAVVYALNLSLADPDEPAREAAPPESGEADPPEAAAA